MEEELNYLSVEEILKYIDEFRESLFVSSGTRGTYVNQLKKFTAWCIESKIERPTEMDFITFREKPILRHYVVSYSGIYHFFRYVEDMKYGKDITKTIYNVRRGSSLNPLKGYTERDKRVNTALWELSGKVIEYEDANKLLSKFPYFLRNQILKNLQEKEKKKKERA